MSGSEDASDPADSHGALVREMGWEGVVGVALMVVIISVMSLGVFFRYVLNDSLTWTEEISRYALIYITYIGCAVAVRRRSHIRVDAIELIVGGRARRAIGWVVDALSLVFFVYMTVKAIEIVGILHGTRSAAIQLPMSYVYAAIIVGFGLSSVRLVLGYLRGSAR